MTEIVVGNVRVIVHSVFSATSTETAVDKAKKYILLHAIENLKADQAQQNLDFSPIQSKYDT